MTEDERQERIKAIRAELAAIQRQEVEDRKTFEGARDAEYAARLEAMTVEEMLDEVASATIRVGSMFRPLHNTKSKPLIGGNFDQGEWRLNSTVMPYTDAGLHCLQYWISDPDKVVSIGNGTSKADAMACARQTMRMLGRSRLAEIIQTRKRELDDIAAAEREEQRRQWTARKERPIPEHREKQVPKRRLTIFNKSAGKCHYCACDLELKGRWHIEHKMPRALLGSNKDDNLVASCVSCNHKKRDMTDVEFIAKREAGKVAA